MAAPPITMRAGGVRIGLGRSPHRGHALPHPELSMIDHRQLIFCMLCSTNAAAQTPSFRSAPLAPMDIPMLPSGNFMEPRSDHFHSGVDLKTNGAEGIPVRAVADGHVSRIRVSPWGYGLALYIDHPEGLTTVYGHLRAFAPEIAEQVLEAQYSAQNQTVDLTPAAGSLPVKAGEVVAWSGNTGGSSAPHLHYEVRRSKDQHALDPETLGLEMADSRPPVIRGLRIYPTAPQSRCQPYPGTAKGFATDANGDGYGLQPGVVPAVFGPVGIAVHAVDFYDGTSNTCGVRKIAVLIDEKPHFEVHLNEVDFDKQRYVNAHMDHALFRQSDMHYHRCYRQPNDRSDLYSADGGGAGTFTPIPGQLYKVRIVVTDANDNRSELTFQLRGATVAEAVLWEGRPDSVNTFHWDRDNLLARPDFRFSFPANALYDDEPIRFDSLPGKSAALGPEYRVLSDAVPLHLPAEVSIRMASLAPALQSKAVVVKRDGKGRTAPIGGTWKDGWVTARTKAFGTFMTRVDTVPPTLTPLDIRTSMAGRASFRLKVQDDLTGLDKWSATLDGKWILLSYEPKTKILTHTFDKFSEGKGKRSLVVEVTDERGNRKSASYTFER
ncbi:MAG: M23 family metallopeptidase [Flavobacteriales bacterium]|nr:M23 family metallopeptidase [Flavobacteriales bacterium]